MAILRTELFRLAISFASLTLLVGTTFLFPFTIPSPNTFALAILLLAFLMTVMEFKVFELRHTLLHFIALPLALLFPNPTFIMIFVLSVLLLKGLALRRDKPLIILQDSLGQAFVYGITAVAAAASLNPSLPLRAQPTQTLFSIMVFALFRPALQLLTKRDREPVLKLGLVRMSELLILIPILLFADVLQENYGLNQTLLVFIPVGVLGFLVKTISDIEKKKMEIFQHGQELKVIQEISNLSMVEAIGSAFFQKVCDLLKLIIPIDSAAVIFWESFDPDHPIQVYTIGEVQRRSVELQNVVESLKLYERAPDMAEITNLVDRFWLHKERRSRVVMPLKTQELYMGLLILESRLKVLDRYHNQEIIGILADHLSISVQDYLLRQEMQLMNRHLMNQTETLGKLLEISHEITKELQLDKVLNKVARAVRDTLGFNTVLVSLYNPETRSFERLAQAGLDDVWDRVRAVTVPEDEVIRHWIEDTRISKSFFVEHSKYISSDYDILVKSEAEEWKPGMWHPLNMLFIPLKTGQELVGYLSIDDPVDGRVPTYEKIQALEIFANQAVAAIISARNFEKIRQLSIHDPLTNTYNHRHFQEVLLTELKRHQRMKKPLCLSIIDIDNFKEVNDSFGHLVGDEVLKEMVKIVKTTIRDPLDMVFRYGGEEFMIIFTEMSMEQAVVVAERVRIGVERHIFECIVDGEKHRLNITISLGLSMFPTDAREKDRLIDRADQALYRAKSLGKNRVVTFSYSPDGEDEKGTGFQGS
ncbi:MAG TPA: sensor domain-containing diguanylate cyclase [Thermoanaerobaculia bacterium]|nr:sensor domain-containing diguanylate cyclase [Thermoanaerobaculia bacterium]HUM28878.1 sensor domain-containing diguanylate cyclase [Thermoanaerobaculia bacterium]HXK67189.1 sensor domain-containing diguanylate cyclase [Thermoanaerobaculia bacterium]